MFTHLVDDLLPEIDFKLSVPFVPTDEAVVNAMLDLAGVSDRDLLYDLGCGDGRIVIAAVKQRGARAIGIDMDPRRIEEAREYAGWMRLESEVEFIEDDLLCAEFSEASVVTLYLLNTVNLELRPRLLNELQPGTRIVSHAFDMGTWKPDEELRVDGCNIYLWIVPAQVAGKWQWRTPDGRCFLVKLEQEFQRISGQAWVDDQPAELVQAELRGKRLRLLIQEHGAPVAESFSARYEDGRLAPLAIGSAKTAPEPLPAWEKV